MTRAPTSFADLAERYQSEILRYLIRLLGNQHDAQDVCQDTLLRAHRAFPRLSPNANGRAWLYRIATNSARNAARQRTRQRARVLHVDLDGLPASGTVPEAQRERFRAVTRAVQELPPRQRAALMLRQFHDMTYDDIAACVGGSAAAARANVYQAIKKLRVVLGGPSNDAC